MQLMSIKRSFLTGPFEEWTFLFKLIWRSPRSKSNIYKKKVVAKGFSQQPRIVFGDTFTPISILDTLWLVLTLIPKICKLYQMDVKFTFLNGICWRSLCVVATSWIWDQRTWRQSVQVEERSLWTQASSKSMV